MTVHSHDTVFSFGATVAQVTNISGPGVEVSEVNCTHLTSANGFMEYASGLGNGGEIEFELLYTKAQFNTLYGYLRTTQAWTVTYPDAGVFAGNGHIKSIGAPEVVEDDNLRVSVTIKVTGKPTFTP